MKNKLSIRFSLFFFPLIAAIFLSACSKEDPIAEKPAEFKLPNTDILVILTSKRRAVNTPAFERSFYVNDAKQSLFWTKLSPDYGGKSRTQLYKNAHGYVLVDSNRDHFLISLNDKRVIKRPVNSVDATTGEYLGAFDFDAKGKWRFIHKSEQVEVTATMSPPHALTRE